MATDFNKPVVTDNYAVMLPAIAQAHKDLARMLEPTLTGTHTNVPVGTVQWNATTVRWERYNGTAWVTLPAAGNNVYAISISGNAATTTALETARTIGGVSFNGTANINLPGVNTAGNQNTSGNAATATKLATARTIGGVSFDGTANINLPGVNTTGDQNTSGNAATATLATNATTAASCSGNAATASAVAWAGITSKPTTISGYGISDMGSQSVNYANTAGNGGVTSVNGQTGAVTVSATPTTEQVTAATAGAAAGQLGTYALLRHISAPASSPGATFAGSSLTYTNASGTTGGSVPSGTWRLCGELTAVDASTRSSLWLRIA